MNLKAKFCIEIQKGDFQFVFMMPDGASWGNALDAAFEVLNTIRDQANKAVEQAVPPKEETPDA